MELALYFSVDRKRYIFAVIGRNDDVFLAYDAVRICFYHTAAINTSKNLVKCELGTGNARVIFAPPDTARVGLWVSDEPKNVRQSWNIGVATKCGRGTRACLRSYLIPSEFVSCAVEYKPARSEYDGTIKPVVARNIRIRLAALHFKMKSTAGK